MNCLVIAATPIEIDPLLERLRSGKDWPSGHSLDILITGIGLTATTYSLTRQLSLKRPDLVIQAGVGGCFDNRIPLGSVLAVKKEAIADQSVIELNRLKSLFDLKLVPQNKHPFHRGWLVNRDERLKLTGMKRVSGISVNEISTSPRKIAFYREYFNPVVESMEGAALHYVCLLEQVPFLQLRSISNYIGERNKKKWDLRDSITNLNRELIKLLEII
ncbi:MAG: futalosine hydrolase [Chitinophagaceae bacterium]